MTKRSQIILLLVIVALVLISAFTQQTQELVKGQPVPAFKLSNLAGKQLSMPHDFVDKVVLIGFWADWCASCKKELRDFQGIYQKYQQQGLVVVAINIEQDEQTISDFIQGLNLSYEILQDKKGDVAKKYAVTSLPSALIVDREGHLNTRFLGETPVLSFEQQLVSLL